MWTAVVVGKTQVASFHRTQRCDCFDANLSRQARSKGCQLSMPREAVHAGPRSQSGCALKNAANACDRGRQAICTELWLSMRGSHTGLQCFTSVDLQISKQAFSIELSSGDAQVGLMRARELGDVGHEGAPPPPASGLFAGEDTAAAVPRGPSHPLQTKTLTPSSTRSPSTQAHRSPLPPLTALGMSVPLRRPMLQLILPMKTS